MASWYRWGQNVIFLQILKSNKHLLILICRNFEVAALVTSKRGGLFVILKMTTLIFFQKSPFWDNFYVFRVLKFENLIQIWKSFIPSENLFQTWALQGGAMCMYSTLSRDKLENMNMVHVWNKFFRFELSFQISKLDLRFWKKSNRFSRDKR